MQGGVIGQAEVVLHFFLTNAKAHEIVLCNTVADACLGNCVALRYENVSRQSVLRRTNSIKEKTVERDIIS